MKNLFRFLLMTMAVSAGAAPFQNLNFESAKPPKNPGFESIAAVTALPSWHPFTGSVEEATVEYNGILAGSAGIRLSEFSPAVQPYGRFAVGVFSGSSRHGEAAVSGGIWQRGDVPTDAKTLLFDTDSSITETQRYRVSVNGITLSLQPLTAASPGLSGLAGGDISMFSGQNVELRFEALFASELGFPQSFLGLDNIRFSPVALVPEPSTWALLGVGGALLFWVGKRPKTT